MHFEILHDMILTIVAELHPLLNNYAPTRSTARAAYMNSEPHTASWGGLMVLMS